MQYLQVDAAKSTLYVYPAERDWSDYREDKHFEYHVATLRLFNGQPFSVEINAADVPWAAVLHASLFARLARYARSTHKNQLVSINVIGASTAVRTLMALLNPLTPRAVYNKIAFVDAKHAPKKTS